MKDDLPTKIMALSYEEAKRYLSDHAGGALQAFLETGHRPSAVRVYWEQFKRSGPTPEMTEDLQGALDRGVRFYHPLRESEDEGFELLSVKEIWDACCDTGGRMSARDPAPMQLIVVKIDCQTGVLIDPKDGDT